MQECQALEQIEGPGIWPLRKFGVMKWKHWLAYEWHSGKAFKIENDAEDESSEEEFEYIYSLEDDLKLHPQKWAENRPACFDDHSSSGSLPNSFQWFSSWKSEAE